MNLNELRRLADWMQEANIRSIEVAEPGIQLRMVCDGGGSMPITANFDGSYFSRHPIRMASFVARRDVVRKGDILGILCAGLLYWPVTAPFDGTVLEMISGRGVRRVSRGTTLLRLRPTAEIREA